MIQRPQTLYFLAVAILSIMMMFSDIKFFTVQEESTGETVQVEYDETKIEVNSEKEVISNKEILFDLGIIALLALISILSFKQNKLQVSLSSFNFVAVLLLIALMYYYSFGKDYIAGAEGNLTFYALFPLALLFFNFLGLRGIRKDIQLIRSMDRFR